MKFYDAKYNKSFETDKFEKVMKDGRQYAVATAPSGLKSWRMFNESNSQVDTSIPSIPESSPLGMPATTPTSGGFFGSHKIGGMELNPDSDVFDPLEGRKVTTFREAEPQDTRPFMQKINKMLFG